MTAVGNQFGEHRMTRVTRWLIAAAVVVGVHVGCVALAMMSWTPEEEAEDGPGAMVVELAVLPVASPLDTPDIAHGAPSEESQAAQPSVKETVEEVKTETPPIDPTPTPPEPAVELPRPTPEAEKEPEKEKKEEERKAADHAAVESMAAAPPRVEAPEAPIPVPTKGSTSAQSERARATWERALVSHLSRHKRYPGSARDKRHQGTASVQFTIDRDGRVVAARLITSSGSVALDEEATAMLRRASPLPAPPATVSGSTFDLTLPVQFRLR